MHIQPNIKDILLVGGGHSHALLIRQWAMQPLAGVRLTLISRDVLTPYSGMLPGLIAGHYTVEEMHLDLVRLCAWAGVRFIEAEMTAIDVERRQVSLHGRPAIAFDVLSLDTGSTPELDVPGAREFTVPVKPVNAFHARWLAIRERMAHQPQKLSLGVVGSGAGGFELVMAMRHSLAADACSCHWFIRDDAPLEGRPARVGELAEQAAAAAGVVMHKQFDVDKVTSAGVTAIDGRNVALDEIVWCTAARAPGWASTAGLATDNRGFVATNDYLQSVSHEFVFATGDIGTQVDTPSAKAGVFAVRQAPFLFENLRRFLLKRPLKTYRPQGDFLSLMAAGRKTAIASRGPLAVSADWVWRWKDHIDQKFMNSFRHLPKMQPPRQRFLISPRLLDESTPHVSDLSADAMRCSGCGAKVGADILHRVLAQLQPYQRDDVLSGLADAGDAAVITSAGKPWVQSVDQLRSLIDDPWVFGRVAALHALSDVVALRGEPQSAQALVTLPFAVDAIVERDLYQLLAGAVDVLNAENCALVGGHTGEGSELQLGFVVNALLCESVKAGVGPRSVGPQPEDRLVLTQAIGIGVLFAGLMQNKAQGVDIRAALQAMQQSNRTAADILASHGATAMTDVTGFGLLGHAQQLLRDTALQPEFELNSIPLLDGAVALARQGVRSSLWRHNSQALKDVAGVDRLTECWRILLCDPQTGGGMLGSVPEKGLTACLSDLHQAGYIDASMIGNLATGTAPVLNRHSEIPDNGEQTDTVAACRTQAP